MWRGGNGACAGVVRRWVWGGGGCGDGRGWRGGEVGRDGVGRGEGVGATHPVALLKNDETCRGLSRHMPKVREITMPGSKLAVRLA